MKANTEKENTEFKPFDLILTIESKRELEFIWVLFNASPARKLDLLNQVGKKPNWSEESIKSFTSDELCSFDTTQVWQTIDDKLKEISR